MATSKKKSKKPKRNIGKAVAAEASERLKGEMASQQQFFRSELRSKLESLLPRELQWMLPLVENFRRGPAEPEAEVEAAPLEVTGPEALPQAHLTETLYRQYRCWNGDPLSCHFPQQTVQHDPKAGYCSECSFPATLAENSEIRGSRGRYRIDRWLRRRGLGRLYLGTQLSDDQPVVVQEFLLPTRGFSEAEIRQRKAAFVRLAGISSVDGRIQDYRLLAPWEAIADQNLERCYLITKGKLDTYPTLNDYLLRYGAMTQAQVRQVLNQVLQTLEFLHGQKLRLPGGQVQPGLPHGNLTLESLLIAPGKRIEPTSSLEPGLIPFEDTQFHIYVTGLALWESVFELPTVVPRHPSIAQDLSDLGHLGFYLLAGQVRQPGADHPIDPKEEAYWGTIDPAFKGFLLRLMGLDTPFETAETARQALLKLPATTAKVGAIQRLEDEEDEPIETPRFPWMIYGLIGLGLLGLLAWWLLAKFQTKAVAPKDTLVCCINRVAGVPQGEFTYTAEAAGSWSYVLQQQDLLGKDKTLANELASREPKLKLLYRPEATIEAALAQVRTEQRDFAIASLTTDLGTGLEQQEVAYDGLAVFVAFSYAQREKSLPMLLQGKITLEQLQQLYTGRVKNWRELGGPDLPVKLYVPTETEAIRVFEQRVLKTEQNIAQFRSLLPKPDPKSQVLIQLPGQLLQQRPTFQTLREVIQDFEDDDRNAGNQVGAIAFGTFSKVFGQCSVYPLAIADQNTAPVQALVQDNGQPINPTTDLCRNKGSYRPKIQVFKTRQYPLAYSIAVVYPRDNSQAPAGEKFANILRTEEGQRLLQQTGLVPLTEF